MPNSVQNIPYVLPRFRMRRLRSHSDINLDLYLESDGIAAVLGSISKSSVRSLAAHQFIEFFFNFKIFGKVEKKLQALLTQRETE